MRLCGISTPLMSRCLQVREVGNNYEGEERVERRTRSSRRQFADDHDNDDDDVTRESIQEIPYWVAIKLVQK